MRQYHITFICHENHDTHEECFIVKADTKEIAIAKANAKAELCFREKDRKFSIVHIEYFDLDTYPLTDEKVKELVSLQGSYIDAETLGKLIVWFNDRELEFIFSFFNNDLAILKSLENILFPCEIKIDYEKLEKLRSLLA